MCGTGVGLTCYRLLIYLLMPVCSLGALAVDQGTPPFSILLQVRPCSVIHVVIQVLHFYIILILDKMCTWYMHMHK